MGGDSPIEARSTIYFHGDIGSGKARHSSSRILWEFVRADDRDVVDLVEIQTPTI
jgi:hypothetical protein